ncbi:UNVERIFIED_CONTAM: hypothetical protein Scaly_1050300 [Sesamum calycinum]|uniref:Uncharacterized protein n=1 Tax=Sesamum calycinum TaxID=2727403 RepID=A0AAW2QKG7_9LAMI
MSSASYFSGNGDDEYVQTRLNAPMPWIGAYVAAASVVCALAMAADVVYGFRCKKLWFPCKFFSLNATSLTLLAVALKLPVDLTTNMWAVTDRLAKVSSLAFMSTATANFVTSLGSMGDQDIIMNVTALSILVITVFVDVFIQIAEMRPFIHRHLIFPEEVLVAVFMILLLFLLVSSAIMVLSTKRYLDGKYQEMHSAVLSQELRDMRQVTTQGLRALVKKYWVMAKTSNPQFVIAGSAICTACGLICALVFVITAEAEIRMILVHKRLAHTASVYGNSTTWILIVQSIGVIVGSVAPLLRWCMAIKFRCSSEIRNFCFSRDEFKIREYWTERLVQWKGSSSASGIRHRKFRKFVHDAKGLTLDLFMNVQIFIILSSKLILAVSTSLLCPFYLCFQRIERLRMQRRINSLPRDADQSGAVADLRFYALRLDGEVQLPNDALKSITDEVDDVFKIGRIQGSNSLLQFLRQSHSFNGVIAFDSNQVPSLHYREPPNCWSLPVVTLTSIAISLPRIPRESVDGLISSVRRGLSYAKLIEKCLYNSGDLANIRKAAETWAEVELYRKWQGVDLGKLSRESVNSKKSLKNLATVAIKTVLDFKRKTGGCLMMSNPLNWPDNIVSANSMYRISQTILSIYNQSDHHDEQQQADEHLFQLLSDMIADILSACLTNLSRVITIKCHRNAIEERERSVFEAALLLGETEDILELLWRRELPISPDSEQAAYIDGWRSVMELDNGIQLNALSSSENDPPENSGDHVFITMMED